MADSQLELDVAEPAAPGGAFTTALAMLVYDVCYLAHTQAVEVPLAQAGEVLGNLWAVCCSPELGRCVCVPPFIPLTPFRVWRLRSQAD